MFETAKFKVKKTLNPACRGEALEANTGTLKL
jgi:hypothetical protein